MPTLLELRRKWNFTLADGCDHGGAPAAEGRGSLLPARLPAAAAPGRVRRRARLPVEHSPDGGSQYWAALLLDLVERGQLTPVVVAAGHGRYDGPSPASLALTAPAMQVRVAGRPDKKSPPLRGGSAGCEPFTSSSSGPGLPHAEALAVGDDDVAVM